MMEVSALSPRRLVCGSEVKQYNMLVKTHQERRQTQTKIYLWLRACSRGWKLCVFSANAERRCLLGSWIPRRDDRNGETFLQAKILWLENHLFWPAEYDVERQAKRDGIHAESHRLSIFVGAFMLTSTYFDSHPFSYRTHDFQVSALKGQVPRTHTHTHTQANTRRSTRSPYTCPTPMKVQGSSTYEYAYTNTYRNKTNTHTCFMDLT